MGSLRAAWQELLRILARRRWLVAAGLAAAAVATALPALAPAPPAGTTVLTAARDLAAGSPLSAADVVAVSLPNALVPAGALASDAIVAGRLVAGAVRRGEPLTDVRLVGAGLLAALPEQGLVAVPLRLADPASVALLRPGDRVDVLAAGTTPDAPLSALVVASDAPVLVVPAQQAADLDGALVVVATSASTAARLAAAAVSSRLSVVVRG